MLNLKELLGDKPEMKDAVGLLYAQEKRAEMAAQETQEVSLMLILQIDH